MQPQPGGYSPYAPLQSNTGYNAPYPPDPLQGAPQPGGFQPGFHQGASGGGYPPSVGFQGGGYGPPPTVNQPVNLKWRQFHSSLDDIIFFKSIAINTYVHNLK